MDLYILLLIVFFSSLILTMIGLGGGLIFSPLFVLLNFPVSTAVSASLFLNGIAASSAVIVYLRKRMVDFSIAVPLIVTSSLGAPFGALITDKINTRLFMGLLASVIFLAALRMIFLSKVRDRDLETSRLKKIVGGGCIGFAIGFIAGVLGIGGGVFIVPLLIYFLNIPTKSTAATSIVIVCFSSFSGFATHAATAVIDWEFIFPAAICSFTGGQIGSRIMAEKLRGRTIRILFGILLLLFCAKLFHRVF
ncbi:MAG: sulfite exporter TauE/SafE family protein [Pseudomonadota bacterium]